MGRTGVTARFSAPAPLELGLAPPGRSSRFSEQWLAARPPTTPSVRKCDVLDARPRAARDRFGTDKGDASYRTMRIRASTRQGSPQPSVAVLAYRQERGPARRPLDTCRQGSAWHPAFSKRCASVGRRLPTRETRKLR